MVIRPALSAELAVHPFGLLFHRWPAQTGTRVQSTWEPAMTTGDGNGPDQLDSDWLPDADAQEHDEEEAEAVEITACLSGAGRRKRNPAPPFLGISSSPDDSHSARVITALHQQGCRWFPFDAADFPVALQPAAELASQETHAVGVGASAHPPALRVASAGRAIQPVVLPPQPPMWIASWIDDGGPSSRRQKPDTV